MSFPPDTITDQFALHQSYSGGFNYDDRRELIRQHWISFTDPLYGQCFMMNDTRLFPIMAGSGGYKPKKMLELSVKISYVGLSKLMWDWRNTMMYFYLGQPRGSYKTQISLKPGENIS